MLRKCFYLCCLMMLVLAPIAIGATEYTILIDRPAEVGNQYFESAKKVQTFNNKFYDDQKVLNNINKSKEINFEGYITVKKVNEKHQALIETIKVAKLTYTLDGVVKPIVPKGTVIIAYIMNNSVILEINHKKIDPKMANELSFITTLHLGVSDDDIFGTQAKKKIGDHWNVGIDSFLSEYSRSHFKINKSDVVGESKIAGLINIDKQDCLNLTSNISVNKYSVQLPDNSQLMDSSLKISYTAALPVDLKKTVPKNLFILDQFYRANNKKTPDDKGIMMDWHLKMTVEHYIKKVK